MEELNSFDFMLNIRRKKSSIIFALKSFQHIVPTSNSSLFPVCSVLFKKELKMHKVRQNDICTECPPHLFKMLHKSSYVIVFRRCELNLNYACASDYL